MDEDEEWETVEELEQLAQKADSETPSERGMGRVLLASMILGAALGFYLVFSWRVDAGTITNSRGPDTEPGIRFGEDERVYSKENDPVHFYFLVLSQAIIFGGGGGAFIGFFLSGHAWNLASKLRNKNKAPATEKACLAWTCPHCGMQLLLPTKAQGSTVACEDCGNDFYLT